LGVAFSTDQSDPLGTRQIAHLAEVPLRGRVWPRGLPTRAGMGLVAMLVVLGLVAANPGLNLLLLLFGLGAGAVAFNAWAARRQVNVAQTRRILPDVAAVGRPTTIRYEVRNPSRRTALRGLWIVDGCGPRSAHLPTAVTWVPHVPPGQTAAAEATVVPVRRGLCRIDAMRLASKFPFGLYRRLRDVHQPETLLVWPALWRPRIDWLARTSRVPVSRPASSSQRPRGADEFFGMREYRPGDNVRWIHWRRSASLDRLLIREMVDSNPGRVTLAVETAGAAGPADPSVVDRLVSAAASLACDALERGWHVGLIVNGEPAVVLPPAGGQAVRTRLLYELALVGAVRTRRLIDVLNEWPAGPQWAGRAVLLHPAKPPDDRNIDGAAKRLMAAVGPVARLSSEAVADWFDVSDAQVAARSDAAGLGVAASPSSTPEPAWPATQRGADRP
jgi:uncharacterized protein (DUF58 family)